MRRFGRWGLRLLALPLAVALAGVAAPAGGRVPRPIAPGVTVAGLPVGGFRFGETRTFLYIALREPIEFRLDGRRWALRTERLGFQPDVDAAVSDAVRASAGGSVEVSGTVDPDLMARYVRYLDRRLSRTPRDAHVVGLDRRLRPIVAREFVGRKLDRERTAEAIASALRTGAREPVRPVFDVMRPQVTRRTIGPVIVIRRESKGLYLYERGRLVRRMGVATGQAQYPTPLGTFSIVVKQLHPWWYPPDSEWARGLQPVPPGPGNPLGTRWMALTGGLVGIHGTPDAASIGYSASHGCIRMHISDAEWLFNRVRVGTPVVIVSA